MLINKTEAYTGKCNDTVAVIIRIIVIYLLAFGLSSCVTLVDFETAQEKTADLVAIVKPDHPVGQTFLAQRGGINSITIWAGNNENSSNTGGQAGSLAIEIYRSPTDDVALVSQQVIPGSRGSLKINFPPLSSQDGEDYYLSLSVSEGEVNIWGQSYDGYANGTAWYNNQSISGDIAFKVSYAYGWQGFLSDITTAASQLGLALPFIFVLYIPGWLLLDLSGIKSQLDGGEKIAVCVGLSLSIIPVIMLWTTTFNLQWNQSAVRVAAGLLCLLTAWRLLPSVKNVFNSRRFGAGLKAMIGQHSTSLALGCIFIASLCIRLVMVRDYASAAWVDSVHHALITRLIILTGGFPATYEPYLHLPPTQYHAGYHSNLATFLWISQMDLTTGMLLYGQVLNSLTIFAVYILAFRLTKNRIAGILAALFTGLFTPMPAYYTSWGRYTQLAGLLVLPVVFTLLQMLLERNAVFQVQASTTGEMENKNIQPLPALKPEHKILLLEDKKIISLLILALAGLILIHYRVLLFVISLLLADWVRLFLLRLKGTKDIEHGNTIRSMTRFCYNSFMLIAIPCLGAFVVTLPWMGPNLTQLLVPALNPSRVPEVKLFSDFSWRFLTTAMGLPILIMAVGGVFGGIIRRKNFVITMSIWIILLLFLANLSFFHIPGGWLMNNTTVEIILFIPMSILAGYLLSDGYALILPRLPVVAKKPVQWICIFAMIAASTYASTKLLTILNTNTYLFRRADREAIAWIDGNIPKKETILINPFNWGYNLYAGNDGGYWITPLTGNPSLPPPVLYGFQSQSERQAVVDMCKQVIEKSGDPQALRTYLLENQIHYVYVGARGGPLSTTALMNSNGYQLIYQQKGVYIFKVVDNF